MSGHTVICGFGIGGRSAANELMRRGSEPARIVVIDQNEDRLLEAAELGLVGLRGDATREIVLRDANIQEAAVAFVCLGRDDTTVLTTLTIHNLSQKARVVALVKDSENERLVRNGGADATICPSTVSGILMANSVSSSNVATYIHDMLTIDGRVTLIERQATDRDVGRKANEIADGLLLRVHRGDRVIGFWESDFRIAAGDTLIVLSPRARQSGP